MKSSFEVSLLESGEIFKKGYLALAGNAGRAVALITLVISALVLFTEISFCEFGSKSFTSTVCVMLLASYLMYFSMEDAGEKLGEDSEEYKSSRQNYTELTTRISGDDIFALREFCKSYSEEERAYRRASYLMRHGLSEEDCKRYKSGDMYSKRAKRVLKRAERIKAVSLSPAMLLSHERRHSKSELSNPEHTKLLHMLLKLVPTTLCMLLTVSVVLSAKESLNAAAVIDGLFKLSSLPVIGFRGYASGYSYTRHTLPSWLETKTRLLDAFLAKKGE